MFKKIFWIIAIILLILAIAGLSFYIAKSNGLLSIGDKISKCQNTECCKNAGYDYFDTAVDSCYSAGTLDSSQQGGGSNG